MTFAELARTLKGMRTKQELIETSIAMGYGPMNLYMAMYRINHHHRCRENKLQEIAGIMGYKVMYTVDDGEAMDRQNLAELFAQKYRDLGRGRCFRGTDKGYSTNYLYQAIKGLGGDNILAMTFVMEKAAELLGLKFGYELVPLEGEIKVG